MLHRHHSLACRCVISACPSAYRRSRPAFHSPAALKRSRGGASSSYIPAWPTVSSKYSRPLQSPAGPTSRQFPKRSSTGTNSTLVHAHATASCKHGPALEAPTRANFGQFVGAAARGGSESVARQKLYAPGMVSSWRGAVPLCAGHSSCAATAVRPNPSFNLTPSGWLRQPPVAG
jgi:hypothetical protein